MSKVVESHHFPTHAGTQRYWERHQEKLERFPELLKVRMGNFEALISEALRQIGLGVVCEKPHGLLCPWLHVSLELAVGLFKATRHTGKEDRIEIECLGTRIEIPTGGTRHGTPTVWLTAFCLALTTRESPTLLNSLAQHNPHGSYETHTAIWGDALIMWLTDDQDPSELLEVAAGYTDEAEYQRDLAVKVHKPLILATHAIYDEDAFRFNECLAEALQGHRAVLGTGEAANSPANLLSFEALGLCSLAYDRGLSIEVESGYIPKWIYEGGCKERPDLQAYVKEVSGS